MLVSRLLNSKRTSPRRGTAAVEFALVLPVFLVFVFGLVEYGKAQMTANMLQNACREAARLGSTEGVTTSQVEQRVRNLMAPGIGTEVPITVIVRDASILDAEEVELLESNEYADLPTIELDNAEPRQMFVVRAWLSYDDASIIPWPLLKNMTLTGMSFMRHE
ncbi:MAG: hypothetical protein ACI9HK_005429 [Pirellulaceae bacterium]|jgi:hypothetical protein